MDGDRLKSGWEIARKLIIGLRSRELLPAIYPALFCYGLPSNVLHSNMLSALVLLGDRLGYSPVADSPVFDYLDNLLIGEGNKRPDSIWFDRGTDKVRALIEFERYKPGAIEDKTRNLMIMNKSVYQDLQLLLLIYWTEAVQPTSVVRTSFEYAKTGFKINGNHFKPPLCPFLLLEAMVKRGKPGLFISDFTARCFVYGKEDKEYIVDDLNRA